MEQPTVGNDRDKIPANSGIELGWFVRSDNIMIYFIMGCKKNPLPSFVRCIMTGIQSDAWKPDCCHWCFRPTGSILIPVPEPVGIGRLEVSLACGSLNLSSAFPKLC